MPVGNADKYAHNISPIARAQASTSALDRDCSDTFFPMTDIVVMTTSATNRRSFGATFGSTSAMNR